MLDFRPFSLTALLEVLPIIRKNLSLCSDLTAGYLFMWQEGMRVFFCLRNDTLIVRQDIGEQPAFSYPLGPDADAMTDELISYVREQHLPLRFFAVDETTLEKIRSDSRLRPAMLAFDRRWSDYIYSFEEALTFRGKKYSGQRNHINNFRKLYGEPVLRSLRGEDLPAVGRMLAEYETEHPDARAFERLELQRTKELLSVCPELGLYIAGLFVGEELAAFSIGEVIGDMLVIHVEKALIRYRGIYPAMYSAFVRYVADRLGHPLRYVNREDDSGDPGLRTSKMQYQPLMLAHKYLVHVKTPALKAGLPRTLTAGDVYLTEFRETDKPVYFRLNTDIENNRHWGYDYREDSGITGPVNEDTFYDSVLYDMQAGDSVNFAVRLSEDGAMIGEAVLWDFTYEGNAELGCRLLPEYQGRGYGKAVFRAAADFAAETLGVKVTARCCRGNEISRKMITGCGFIPSGQDETFFWFELPAASAVRQQEIRKS
ncbi:MAG: GNAT family N-acetyltransferase [Erysipelotrichaceae bacterium]|nr:GNAT family N-acetyltransferase [Erysipelotrichaceae bacterium]